MSESLTNSLLALHIISACAWLGANFTQLFVGAKVGAASSDVRIWWAEKGAALARTFYNVAGTLLFATGLVLVIWSPDPGGYSFASVFVSVGFAAVIVGGALGVTVFAPKNRALAQAVRDGDGASESRLRTLLTQFAVLDTLVVVVTIVVMVWKVGAKFKGLQ